MAETNKIQARKNSGLEASDLGDILEKGKAMVALLEQGQTDAATSLLDDLTRLRERELFMELGHLTRHLHDALKSVRLSDEVSELVEEFPDARQRLGYVVRLTEEAANKTLSVIEGLVPQVELTSIQARQLLKDVQALGLGAGDSAGLHSRLQLFLEKQADSGLHSALSKIMMTQDFQDITGQIIQRVIMLVEEIEAGLVDILRKNPFPKSASNKPSTKDRDWQKGPAIPGLNDDDRIENQDDVDQLLLEYGF